MNRIVSAGFALLFATIGAAAGGAAPSSVSVFDSEASLQRWTLPVLPTGTTGGATAPRSLRVRFVVDPTGKVTGAHLLRSRDPALTEAVLGAVRSWTFSPALQDSKPVAVCLDAEVPSAPSAAGKTASANALPAPKVARSPVTEAAVKMTADADYPDELAARKLPGIVQFTLAVDPEGRRSNLTVTYASNVAFVLPALEAVAKWEVTPAKQGDLPKAADLRGDVTFNAPTNHRSEVLAANFITAPDGSEPNDIPTLNSASNPVWPYEDQVAAQPGDATVKFTVGTGGLVEEVAVTSASKPEFGQALAAVVTLWRFSPAVRDGQAVAVPLAVHWTFGPPTGEAADSEDETARKQLLLSAKAGQIPTGGLDHRLRPIFRLPPVYPLTLAGGARPSGEATIKFIIAPAGRVCLPQVMTATNPEFGAMAATAVAQWLFEAPMKGGKPTAVAVQAPFRFAPPAER